MSKAGEGVMQGLGKALAFAKDTLLNWEPGRRRPTGPVALTLSPFDVLRNLSMGIDDDPNTKGLRNRR